jgi:PTH1 family peptidyl-tRNA hydrolase
MVVMQVAERSGASDWRDDKKLRARMAQATSLAGEKLLFVLPDNYMNRSGGSLSPLVKNAKQAARLIVVHDDIDLPLGSIKIVFDRGAGGHRGVASVVRSLKTQAFVRVRVGVVPVTPTGKLKKPQGEDAVLDLILRPLTKRESDTFAPIVTRAADAVQCIVQEGYLAAMRTCNGGAGQRMQKKKRGSKKPAVRTAPTKRTTRR